MAATDVLKAKVSLAGQAAVGKTSLVRRFVLNMYDDHYLMTVGTKVSKKTIVLSYPERDLTLQVDMSIWDTMGQEEYRDVLADSLFDGVQGVLAVADLTRRATLDDLYRWIERADRAAPGVPIVIALNKADLEGRAQFSPDDLAPLAQAFSCSYLPTSAKTGKNVEEAFQRLARAIAAPRIAHPSKAPSP